MSLVVIDTNILVSAQLKQVGNEAVLLKLWQQRIIQFAVSEAILAEYRRVLQYPHIQGRLQWSPQRLDALLHALRTGSLVVSGTVPVAVALIDESDKKFLACAKEAGADAVIS